MRQIAARDLRQIMSQATHWGDGTTSSSDGQRFKVGGKAESTGHINPKYGAEPGRTFYTHLSDQFAPYHAKAVNVGVRDATYVLDGLLYHESDLRIEEHYTNTAGFTDHVFALMHLLGFRFAPRLRDLGETRLYVPKRTPAYTALKPTIGGVLQIKSIRAHWDEILRLATSIKQGTVTASLMLRKLGSYPRQNGLAVALRELGRIERTLFILDWLQSVELRRRVHTGLNKGEARNALARAVFFYRLWRNPRPQLRAAAISRQRAHPGHRCHRLVEHGLPRTSHQRSTRKRAYPRPGAPKASFSAWLGARQSHRRLPMAQHRETR
jgi:TnpA family transposase